MDENSIEEIKANKNDSKFSTGCLTAIVGYILNIVLVVVLVFVIGTIKHGASSSMNDDTLTGLVIVGGFVGIYGLILWIPLGIIAGNISKKSGFKSALWFVGASICIISLVVGTCNGITF